MAYKRVATRMSGRRVVRQAMGAYPDLPAQGPSGDCGADQKYDPSFVFMQGMAPGQCVNQAQYDAYHAGQTSSSSFLDSFTAGLASIFKPAGTPAPVVMPGSSGIGTGTALAIGGGALLLVVLLTRK